MFCFKALWFLSWNAVFPTRFWSHCEWLNKQKGSRKERTKERSLDFFLWGNFYRRSYWRSTRWYLWRPALLVAEARQLLFLALLWWLVCKKERTPWDLDTISGTRPCFSSHYVWGFDAEVMSAAWPQNVRSWSSTEASSMYTWASLQMRWDWFMVFCVTSMTSRIWVMWEWLSSKQSQQFRWFQAKRLKKLPVDFKMYAHYSGQRCFWSRHVEAALTLLPQCQVTSLIQRASCCWRLGSPFFIYNVVIWNGFISYTAIHWQKYILCYLYSTNIINCSHTVCIHYWY